MCSTCEWGDLIQHGHDREGKPQYLESRRPYGESPLSEAAVHWLDAYDRIRQAQFEAMRNSTWLEDGILSFSQEEVEGVG